MVGAAAGSDAVAVIALVGLVIAFASAGGGACTGGDGARTAPLLEKLATGRGPGLAR